MPAIPRPDILVAESPGGDPGRIRAGIAVRRSDGGRQRLEHAVDLGAEDGHPGDADDGDEGQEQRSEERRGGNVSPDELGGGGAKIGHRGLSRAGWKVKKAVLQRESFSVYPDRGWSVRSRDAGHSEAGHPRRRVPRWRSGKDSGWDCGAAIRWRSTASGTCC